MAYPKRSKDGRRRGPSAEDCRRIWGLPQMSTGDMRNVSIGMDEPVEESIPSDSVPGGRNVTGGGPARGRGHRRPTSRGWAHRSRGVTESILPAVKHMAAPATRSCPKTCRCPIPEEQGGLTMPTVVAGDKNRYIITDSFNRKRGEALVRRGFGGHSASVKRHNGLEDRNRYGRGPWKGPCAAACSGMKAALFC